jgi:hypothetical protein
MGIEPQPPTPPPAADPEWEERLRYWRPKLGRIRLGVEPVDEQLARYRRVTWLLTAIPAALAVFFVSLFGAFGRPGVGLVVAGVILAPVVALAWLDYAILAGRVGRYRRERRSFEQRRGVGTETPGGS